MIKALLKNAPVIGSAIKYFKGTCIQPTCGKQNSTFFNYSRNIVDCKEYEKTKVHKESSLYKDRYNEVKKFFNKNDSEMLLHFIINGTPNTNYYKYKMHKIFERIGLDREKLKKAYENAAFMYVNRLMLRYHNYDIGGKILEIITTQSRSPQAIKVLDYGCGVADISLYLALHGAKVTLVDLDDKKFEFTLWRFDHRNMKIKSKKAYQTEKPVDLGDEKFDAIVMAEFLEHVREPRLFLEFALDHLNEDGLFYDSLGPVHNHGIGGDHLREAKHLIETTDYSEFHRMHLSPFKKINGNNSLSHFYIKKQ